MSERDEEVIEAYVSRERHVRPFAELSHANSVLLTNLREKREGWSYEAMTCLVVSAFKVEAVCNEIGSRIYDCWENMERLRFEDKAAVIAKAAKYELDWGRRPFQTVRSLMKARNELAHGKPVCLSQSGKLEKGTREELRRRRLDTFWEQHCTVEFAERADEDTERFAEEVSAAGIEWKEMRFRGSSYSIREKQDEAGEIEAGTIETRRKKR